MDLRLPGISRELGRPTAARLRGDIAADRQPLTNIAFEISDEVLGVVAVGGNGVRKRTDHRIGLAACPHSRAPFLDPIRRRDENYPEAIDTRITLLQLQ